MIDLALVNVSRLQFALTALYHFLFVPLTLGLSMILVIMEAVYVMTGREIWKRMTRFWGLLFGINFAMGVATGITMEFQFGTNWRSEEHTSELQSRLHLVCRLLLEKKNPRRDACGDKLPGESDCVRDYAGKGGENVLCCNRLPAPGAPTSKDRSFVP